jgi:hypothetical protein
VTAVDELLAFVTARLSEEERDAREAGAEEVWQEDGATVIRGHPTYQVVDWVYDDRARHIARQDPRATIARVAALRALVAPHERIEEYGEAMCRQCSYPSETSGDLTGGYWPCDTLRHVAAIWGWHPDFREAWAS